MPTIITKEIVKRKKTLFMFDIEHDGRTSIILKYNNIIECVLNTGIDEGTLNSILSSYNINIKNIDSYVNINTVRTVNACKICGQRALTYNLIANSKNYNVFKEFVLSSNYDAHVDCLNKSIVCNVCGKLKLKAHTCPHCKDGESEYKNIFKLNQILSKIEQSRKKLLYLGIELELEAKYNSIPDELWRIRKEVSKYAIQLDKYLLYSIYEDGSLRFGNEFSTLPKVYKFYFSEKFKQFYELLMSDSESSHRAGVHINVPKKLFTFNQLQAIQKVFNDIACNSNLYSKFLAYLERTPQSMQLFAVLYNNMNLRQQNKHYSLNTIYEKRVEFRLFGSTNNFDKLLSFIQFVKAIYNYTKGKTYQRVSFSGFVNFVKNSNEYDLLYRFLLDYNLIE